MKSVPGVVGPVSVGCDWVRGQVWYAISECGSTMHRISWADPSLRMALHVTQMLSNQETNQPPCVNDIWMLRPALFVRCWAGCTCLWATSWRSWKPSCPPTSCTSCLASERLPCCGPAPSVSARLGLGLVTVQTMLCFDNWEQFLCMQAFAVWVTFHVQGLGWWELPKDWFKLGKIQGPVCCSASPPPFLPSPPSSWYRVFPYVFLAAAQRNSWRVCGDRPCDDWNISTCLCGWCSETAVCNTTIFNPCEH